MEKQKITRVAQICHETNRAYCESIGDYTQKPWATAEQWQIESAVRGVEFKLANPDAAPSAQHDAWTADKVKDGWVFGAVKDASAKTHPCLVPYGELPVEQRIKDYLFVGIVQAFLKAEQE